MKKDKWILGIVNFLFPLCLFSFAMIGVNQGADLTDTTYSMGNYMYFESMEGSWKYATFLANLLGYGLFCVTGGSFLWMNVISRILVGAIAVAGYVFMKRYISPYLVFAGEMIALGLCWCPTVILYNYLSYFFFALAGVLLVKACQEEKTALYFTAGCFLGINVMVRIPNVLQVLLIFVVWYHCLKNGEEQRWKLLFQRTGICITGFVSGFLAAILLMLVTGGGNGFSEMVEWLLSMLVSGSDSSGYSAGAMLGNILEDYALNLKWLFIIAAGTIAGMLVFRKWSGKYLLITKIGYVFCLVLLFVYFYRNRVFRLIYNDYSSIFNLSVIFILLGIVCAIWQLVFNKRDVLESELAVLLLVVIAISPLGSNNHLYSSINNLFIAAPVTLHFMKKMTEKCKGKQEAFPLWTMLTAFVAVLAVQSILFHIQFVFRGPAAAEQRNYCLTEANVLNGMWTGEIHGRAIEGLIAFMETSSEDEVILYGEIPGVSYLLGQKCAVSTAWPDLASYSLEDWEADLSNIEDWEKVSIIVVPHIAMLFNADEEETENLSSFMEEDSRMEKVLALYEVIQTEGFSIAFENEEFIVYQIL